MAEGADNAAWPTMNYPRIFTMKSQPFSFIALSVILVLGGCVSVPQGPSTMALPGSGKSFDQFRADDAECRQYAQSQTGGIDANQAAANAGISSAAVGTVVGAIAGAAIGGHQGAGAGAATGLLVGSMAGTGAAQASARGTQRSYDIAYTQCMYAKGEQVSMPGAPMRRHMPAPAYYPAPLPPPSYYPVPQAPAPTDSYYPSSPPPPPPGYQPPPPPPAR